jgi:hypothetical protein
MAAAYSRAIFSSCTVFLSAALILRNAVSVILLRSSCLWRGGTHSFWGENMPAANASTLVVLSRLVWMMFGPMLLTVTALIIANAVDAGWRTTADIAFLLILALTIAARWIEFGGGGAMDGTGKPVSREHVVRYTGIMLVGGLAVWVGANVVANYLL